MIDVDNNEHLVHLIGKNMDELNKMFPDAKVCHGEDSCEFDDIDHAILMEYEQDKINAQRQGKIRVMYREIHGDEHVFYWHNDKDWIELKQ